MQFTAKTGFGRRRGAGLQVRPTAALRSLLATMMFAAGVHVSAAGATGLTIELKDVAPDRVERQRAAALGALPLPGTPDLANRSERLAAKGLKAGDPVFLRIFKSESILEVWMRKDSGVYVLFESYPICHWSGTIGPKVSEGDKQNPEGFYTITRSQLHLIGRHPRSLNLGFPNPYDKALGRNGSYILVHGGCTSVGCFAMTNAVIAEIYDLAEQALKRGGQNFIHVHAFPFRMTEQNVAAHAASPWFQFWTNLKEGYDAFEQTKLPPRIGICDKRYSVQAAGAATGSSPHAPGEVADQGPLAVCGATTAAIQEIARFRPPVSVRQQSARLQSSQARQIHLTNLPLPSSSNSLGPQSLATPSSGQRWLPTANVLPLAAGRTSMTMTGRSALGGPVSVSNGQASDPATMASPPGSPAHVELQCQIGRASCRRWAALQVKAASKRAVVAPKPVVAKRTKAAAR